MEWKHTAMSKKIISVFFLVACVGVFLAPALSPRVAAADNLIGPLNQGDTASPVSSPSDFGVILEKIVTWVYEAFFIAAVLFFLLAAYNFMLGGSSEDRIKTAKNQLKWGVVAIVVALLSVGVAYAIDTFLRTGA
jgi:multisubunit Na+/H+ antiporter MnhF subunit